MRRIFIATAATAALLAIGAFPDRAGAADVGPPYGPPSAYDPPYTYSPPPGYRSSDEYEPPPAYGPPPSAYPSPRYSAPDDYGPPLDHGPPPRPPYSIPYAVSPVRPACDLQWRCGPWGGCGWRRVCYPVQPSAEHYARPYRGYGAPAGPGYYGPY